MSTTDRDDPKYAHYYTLAGRQPIRCTLMEWAQHFGKIEWQVAFDTVGEYKVNTRFHGHDQWHFVCEELDRPPHCFGTGVFGPGGRFYEREYQTWDEAEAGHRQVVENLKQGRALWQDEEMTDG